MENELDKAFSEVKQKKIAEEKFMFISFGIIFSTISLLSLFSEYFYPSKNFSDTIKLEDLALVELSYSSFRFKNNRIEFVAENKKYWFSEDLWSDKYGTEEILSLLKENKKLTVWLQTRIILGIKTEKIKILPEKGLLKANQDRIRRERGKSWFLLFIGFLSIIKGLHVGRKRQTKKVSSVFHGEKEEYLIISFLFILGSFVLVTSIECYFFKGTISLTLFLVVTPVSLILLFFALTIFSGVLQKTIIREKELILKYPFHKEIFPLNQIQSISSSISEKDAKVLLGFQNGEQLELDGFKEGDSNFLHSLEDHLKVKNGLRTKEKGLRTFEDMVVLERKGYSIREMWSCLLSSPDLLKILNHYPYNIIQAFPHWKEELDTFVLYKDFSDFNCLWVKLERAFFDNIPQFSGIDWLLVDPESSQESEICKAWHNITKPENLPFLKERMEKNMNKNALKLTLMAIKKCKMRVLEN